MLLVATANPRSGSGLGPDPVERYLRDAGARVRMVGLNEMSGNVPAEARRVVVAGGDGSIGTAARAAHEAGLPLAVIPTGTANDFARAVGLPLDVERACALAADPDASTRRQELGLVGGRPFVNMAATGLSTVASRHAESYKSRLGPLAYVVGAFKAGARASPIRCTVVCDGEESFAGEAWQLVIGATGAFGGGSAMGGTRADDSELDVAVVPRSARVALFRYAYAMRRGRLTSHRDVLHNRGRVIEVDLPRGFGFNVDGDVNEFHPARFSLLERGFDLVVPTPQR